VEVEGMIVEKEFGRHLPAEDRAGEMLTQEAVLAAMPEEWTPTKDLARMLGARPNALRRALGRLRAKGLAEQRRMAHGTGAEWRPTGASLELRRCPVCGRAPEVGRFDSEGVEMWRAECWCTLVVGTDADDLRHRWDDLYCADDPATGRDCI
jgi:hypothetical protein